MSPILGIVSIIIISKVIIMYFRSVFSQSGIWSSWHFTLRHLVLMAFYTQAFCLHGILHSGILSHKNFFPKACFHKKHVNKSFLPALHLANQAFWQTIITYLVKQTFYQFGMIGSNKEHFTQRT